MRCNITIPFYVLLSIFLLVALIGIFLHNGPDNDSEDIDLEDFKRSRVLAMTASNTFNYNGRKYNVDEITTPVQLFTNDAKCSINGIARACPPTHIFEKDDGKEIVTIYKNDQQEVTNVLIVDKITGKRIEMSVDTNAKSMTMSQKNIDFDDINKRFRYSHDEPTAFPDRSLRRVTQSSRKDAEGLCKYHKVIKLGVDYETSFCVENGGREKAEAKVEHLVLKVSKMYEHCLCIKVRISHLGGSCNKNQDPFYEAASSKKSGCNGLGLIHELRHYYENVNENKNDFTRDTMFLLTERLLDCDEQGCVIGCANSRSMCTSNAYGVVSTKFTEESDLQALALAHEIGHNAGAFHDSITGFVMYSRINPAEHFSDSSIITVASQESNWESLNGCVEDESEEPSAQPSSIPSKQPSEQPSSIPSSNPSAQPSVFPTGAPTSMPSIQPSERPSSQPSSQPSLHTTSPSAQPSIVSSPKPSTYPSGKPSAKPLISDVGKEPIDCKTSFDPISFMKTLLGYKLGRN